MAPEFPGLFYLSRMINADRNGVQNAQRFGQMNYGKERTGKMLKIMLVDDEVLALEYLKSMVDWEANGYQIVGCATSGKNAMELYEKTQPQIVISDIRMPGTDGLELTRWLKEQNREVVIILLSAYKDFDYAQKGIRYGVSNYLLKHELSSELILKELEGIREKLERADGRKKIYQKYFMNQLIYDQVPSEELDEVAFGSRLFLLLVHKRNPVIQGVFIETCWTEEEQDELEEVMQENLENIVFYVADVQVTRNNWMMLYRIENTASKYTINSLIRRKCTQIQKKLEEKTKCHFNILHSYEITQGEISSVFRRMSNRVRYAFFWKDHKTCSLLELPEKDEKMLWGEGIRALRESVMEEEGEPEKRIEELFEKLEEKASLEDCKMFLPAVSNLLEELCESENCPEIYQERPMYTLEEMKSYYMESFRKIHDRRMEKMQMGYSRTVVDMIGYIRKNYRQELSLEMLGEVFHMNGVYLGQIFKKETGNTFLKYLTMVRMEEAKRLLREENRTVSETAELVGYRTSQYFSQIFMKTTGMKPQEYKRQKETL